MESRAEGSSSVQGHGKGSLHNEGSQQELKAKTTGTGKWQMIHDEEADTGMMVAMEGQVLNKACIGQHKMKGNREHAPTQVVRC